MTEYERDLRERIPEKDSLAIVKAEAKAFIRAHSPEECCRMGLALYESENFQVQEVGVFLLGSAAHRHPEALAFLRDVVSCHPSWKVQEILAMALDAHCAIIGYEAALPLLRAWLEDDRANLRRAVSEGLRVWTSRPYFRDHPEEAVALLAPHREDESEYVRRSIGNALRDISRKHPAPVEAELAGWDLSSKRTMQVYRLAHRFLAQRGAEDAGPRGPEEQGEEAT